MAALQREFGNFIYGRREEGHTFPKWVRENFKRVCYEEWCKESNENKIPAVEAEMEKWQKYIRNSIVCPTPLVDILPELLPLSMGLAEVGEKEFHDE